ncbi:hypothetical protein KSS87_018360 [Heliosperma pusillum]|nr:hypothetical protein KSS87_018360 [Heliosperma pusillum]
MQYLSLVNQGLPYQVLQVQKRFLNGKPQCSSLKQPRRSSLKTTWPAISVTLFGSGFVLGPLIDGLHSRVDLVVYRTGSIHIGPLSTNVPVLLGVFYCTVGLLHLYLDERTSPSAKTQGSLKKTLVSLISLVLFIELSAEMYKSGVPANVEAYALFAAAEFIWFLADRTWFGFALACIVGVACPLAEIPLIKYFHLWDYPQANVVIFGEGLVSWTLTCYFVYTFFLINFSRWLKSVFVADDFKGQG